MLCFNKCYCFVVKIT